MVRPKHEKGLRIGVINPLTLVGTEVQSILRERAFPHERIVLLDSAGDAAGALTEVDAEPAVVASVAQEGLDDLDVVFFCGPAESNREWIERHAEDNFVAIDLSQPTTAEDGKPVIAGVNLDDVGPGEDVFVSPHPAAIPIALLLHQIATVAPVELCTVTVVQPASEFGQTGVEELAQQTIHVLNMQTLPKTVFDRQLAFNLYPAPERLEDFVVSQVRSVIDPRTRIALLLTQGTIFHGHTFSMFVKTRGNVDRDRIVEALSRNPALALQEGDQQFGTIDAAGKDEVLVAEVRMDPSVEGGFWVWAVCDNLRRSSALNAVLIAERVLFGPGMTN